jgi:hypothetical protein
VTFLKKEGESLEEPEPKSMVFFFDFLYFLLINI